MRASFNAYTYTHTSRLDKYRCVAKCSAVQLSAVIVIEVD